MLKQVTSSPAWFLNPSTFPTLLNSLCMKFPQIVRSQHQSDILLHFPYPLNHYFISVINIDSDAATIAILCQPVFLNLILPLTQTPNAIHPLPWSQVILKRGRSDYYSTSDRIQWFPTALQFINLDAQSDFQHFMIFPVPLPHWLNFSEVELLKLSPYLLWDWAVFPSN